MDSRKLIFRTNDKNMKIIIVRASDVPTYVESGKVDMGIVGKDTLLEKNSNDLLRLKDLQIAKCRLVIAGKKGVSLVSNMKIATKYPTITQKYFQSQGLPCTILKLYGSIELAAVLGTAGRKASDSHKRLAAALADGFHHQDKRIPTTFGVTLIRRL